MNCVWNYVPSESSFYAMNENDATIHEIFEYTRLTKAKIKKTLVDLVGAKEY